MPLWRLENYNEVWLLHVYSIAANRNIIGSHRTIVVVAVTAKPSYVLYQKWVGLVEFVSSPTQVFCTQGRDFWAWKQFEVLVQNRETFS